MISVVVPVYNAGNFLERCICSIASQSYKDIEIILVNDGSTDDSLEICNSFSDSRIKIIDKTNGGVSSARNAGLEIASGEYVAFVDSDDTIPTNCLQTLLSGIKECNSDMVMGAFMFQYGKKYRYHSIRLTPGLYEFDTLLSDFIDDGTLSGFLIGSACGVLYKTSIIKTNDLRFRVGLRINEDGLFNFEYALKAKTLNVISDPVYYYRKDVANSASSVLMDSNFNDLICDYLNRIKWDKSRYQYDVQLKRRDVSIALWRILRIPSSMNMKEGFSTIRKCIRQSNVREGFSEILVDKLPFHKKFFYFLMKLQCTFLLYYLVRYIIPIIDSKFSR